MQALHEAAAWYNEQGLLQPSGTTPDVFLGFNFAWNLPPNTQNLECLKLFSLCSEFLLYDRSVLGFVGGFFVVFLWVFFFFYIFLKPSSLSWLWQFSKYITWTLKNSVCQVPSFQWAKCFQWLKLWEFWREMFSLKSRNSNTMLF